MILAAEKITKGYGVKPLFKEIDIYVDNGDKIGVIGLNGTGKTTLLKILAGIESPDSGDIKRGKLVKISYLDQETDINVDLTVLEYVCNQDIKKGYNPHEYEAKDILGRLGVIELDKPISNLSGGLKKRIEIARAILNESELLILDEPTNHLDQDSIIWLEQYLSRYKGALLMVTHDRYFLSRVTNRIVELDNGRLNKYDGSYEEYLRIKLLERESQKSSERKRQSILKKELAWMQQGIKARGTRNKGRVERLKELKESGFEFNKDVVEISSLSTRLGKKIINLLNISKGYDEISLFSNFNYTVLRLDRIRIVGEYGCGKST